MSGDGKCILCGSAESVFVKQAGPSKIVLCRPCGLAYRYPDLHDDLMFLRVPEKKDEVQAYAEGFHRGQALFNRFILKRGMRVIAPPGRLLDVGCGFGDMVAIAADAGWDAYGVDVSAEGVEVCRDKGLNAYHGTTANLPAEAPREYDVVTIKLVLEYLRDPVDEIKRIHSLLKPGGVLIVRALNCDFHVAAHRMYIRLKPLFVKFGLGDPAMFHRFTFSPRALKKAALSVGFEVIEAGPSPMVRGDPYSYAKGAAMKVLLRLFTLMSDVCGVVLWRITGGRIVITPSFIAICRKPEN